MFQFHQVIETVNQKNLINDHKISSGGSYLYYVRRLKYKDVTMSYKLRMKMEPRKIKREKNSINEGSFDIFKSLHLVEWAPDPCFDILGMVG